MTDHKMHADEFTIDLSLVQDLLASQFPQWSTLPLKKVKSAGTSNAMYRLGDNMVVRLPRTPGAVLQAGKEQTWLPKLTPHLPLATPVLLAKGNPTTAYPRHWSIYQWIQGETATSTSFTDPHQATKDIAQFIKSLRQIDTMGAPHPGDHNFHRGVPLITRDQETRDAIVTLSELFDARAMTAVWESALEAAKWQEAPLWVHGDLQPANLLTYNGRLCAVLDFGGLAVGDPACDLQVAWNLFSHEARNTFRDVILADDDSWTRGRGWALSVSVIALPYYQETNPILAGIARRTITEILTEYQRGN